MKSKFILVVIFALMTSCSTIDLISMSAKATNCPEDDIYLDSTTKLSNKKIEWDIRCHENRYHCSSTTMTEPLLANCTETFAKDDEIDEEAFGEESSEE